MSQMLKPSDFTISNTPNRHEIETEAGTLVIYVKPLSWIKQQQAISQFVDFKLIDGEPTPSIDFGGYWDYVLINCVVDSEPKLSKKDLRNLTPEVGTKISEVLPSLDDLVEGMTGGEPSPLE